jgi:hypothetical protein
MDKNDDVSQAFARSIHLRDYFAGLVLSGLISHRGHMAGKFSEDMHGAAEYCYRCADMMLRVREEQGLSTVSESKNP